MGRESCVLPCVPSFTLLTSCWQVLQHSLESTPAEVAVKVFVGLPLLTLASTKGKMLAGVPESRRVGPGGSELV